MRTTSRRSFAGAALFVPLAGIGIAAAAATRHDDAELDPLASPEASPEASPGAIEEIVVEGLDIAFDITEIRIPADTPVTITLINVGVLEHDLYIDELDIGTELLQAGETGSVEVIAPAGEYEFWCTVTGHKEVGMRGVLIAE